MRNDRNAEMMMIIRDALQRLDSALEELKQPTRPQTPMPRFPKWELRIGNIAFTYPGKDANDDRRVNIDHIDMETSMYSSRITIGWHLDDRARELAYAFGYQPTRVLRFVRWLESIERWLRARIAGRQRHAQEILKQQRRAHDELQIRATAIRLRDNSG